MGAQNQNERPGLSGRWVAANALGLGIGMAIFAAIAEGIEQSGLLGSGEAGEVAGHLAGLLVAGAIFGYAQARALRQNRPRTILAMLAAGAGLWLGYVLGYELLGFPFDHVLGPALAATLAGLVHWPLVRRDSGWPGWWIAAGAFGLALGSVPGLALGFMGLGAVIGGSIVGWSVLNGLIGAIAPAIGGALSGVVLVRGSRRNGRLGAIPIHPAADCQVGSITLSYAHSPRAHELASTVWPKYVQGFDERPKTEDGM